MSQPFPLPGGQLPDPVLEDPRVRVYLGDTVELLPRLAPASIDAIVTDPPYGLSLNGHCWDDASGFRESLPHMDTRSMSAAEVFEAWCTAWAQGALDALKPGAHLAAFGGARTWHRMVRGIENAGFEIRDQIAWLHSSGMPKSVDLSYAIDKHRGHHRSDRIVQVGAGEGVLGTTRSVTSRGTPVSDDAARWEGWGTALRPAYEPIIVARRPVGGTIAANLLTHGVGGLNIDATRFGDGKWPMNVVLDASQADALDALTGTWGSIEPVSRRFPIFRYDAKASAAERPRAYGISHSTVKPLSLMRWLVTLLAPPSGTVLEPFAGSGTTIEAAVATGLHVIAFEKDPSYLPLIASRLDRL